MRIIAGEFKGRIIKVPKSKLVRPTTERNKESIFIYLENKIDFFGITVCDLYAGSGSLGLEALSRGAKEVHFVENNFQIYKNLRENLEKIGVEQRSKTFKTSCRSFSKMIDHQKYDLIIADPPFFKYDIYEVVENILSNSFLKQGGILIIERSVQTEEKDSKEMNLKPIKKLGDSLIYEFIFS